MHTKIVKINPSSPESGLIKEAAGILQKGGIVAFPTETVYGLAADYNNQDAVNRLYQIKKRPKDKQFTIHIAEKEKIIDYIVGLDEITKRLIDKFWPGPLTIIVNSKSGKPLGFRMPSNKIALELINESKLTIVAPSANISGAPEPTEPFSVTAAFDGLIDMIIDAGRTEIGVASTVVDLTTLRPKILREGKNTDQIKAVIYEDKKTTNVLVVCTGNSCRSPMAEGLLKRDLEKEGFNIKSAGIMAQDGLAPSLETIDVMKRRENIDMSYFLTHRLTKNLVDWSDLILVMDRIQKGFIFDAFPMARDKTFLFKEYAEIQNTNPDVPDPIGKPYLAYEESYRHIKEGIDKIIKKLKEQ